MRMPNFWATSQFGECATNKRNSRIILQLQKQYDAEKFSQNKLKSFSHISPTACSVKYNENIYFNIKW